MFNRALVATLVFAILPLTVQAMTDKYTPGDTTLSVTEDGYKVEIRDPLVNPGNSLRVYVRPRNGNCTGATYDQKKNALTIHDNPMCDTGNWGWISLNVPSLSDILKDSDKVINVGAMLGGTQKSYDIGFGATVDPTGQNIVIGGLHSEHH
jgi:hypothetical protein